MTVLLTGGAGFIGSHIADALLEDGQEVVIVDDLSTGRRENVPKGALFAEIDIRDEEALGDVIATHRPTVICHQAAQTSVSISTREPIRDAEINIMGSLHLLELARRNDIQRFVFASTGGAIYGEVPDGTADEQTVPHPISPYACSKLAFEGYLRAYEQEHGVRTTILRYANVYGPRQDPHGEAGVVAIFCQRLLDGEPIRVNGMRTAGDDGCIRDYVSVRDVVRANLLAINDTLDARVLNVCTGVATNTRALAQRILDALGQSGEIQNGDRRPGDVERSVLTPNPELLRHGAPIALPEGLAETVRWFAQRR